MTELLIYILCISTPTERLQCAPVKDLSICQQYQAAISQYDPAEDPTFVSSCIAVPMPKLDPKT